jgi:chaperone modulatory protein CbpM
MEKPSREQPGVGSGNSALLTTSELCRRCKTTDQAIAEMVDFGILEPMGEHRDNWRFDAASARRAATALRLQCDLGINLAGAALALDLLERIDRLEARLREAETTAPADPIKPDRGP